MPEELNIPGKRKKNSEGQNGTNLLNYSSALNFKPYFTFHSEIFMQTLVLLRSLYQPMGKVLLEHLKSSVYFRMRRQVGYSRKPLYTSTL